MPDEKRLLEAAIQGDTAAFEVLVQKYQSLICAITFSGTTCMDTSEELAQETFFKAWQNRGQLREIEKFRGWLCSIARNLVRNYHRKNKIQPELLVEQDDLVDTHSDPSEQAVNREEVMILEQALKRIPIEYREPLVLFYRQEQSIRQVAEYLELNEATVRTRLHRGRQMLKEQTVAIVERSLAKTSPDPAFTKVVMAGIGAGIAAGVAGTATAGGVAASAGATGGTMSSAVGGLLATAGGKIVAAIAAIAVTISVAVYSYNSLGRDYSEDSQTITVSPNASEKSIDSDLIDEQSETQRDIKQKPQTLQAQQVTDDADEDGDIETIEEIVLTSSRHPDWPTIDEKIEHFYCYQEHDLQHWNKIWIRFPDHYRWEGDGQIVIDDGRKRTTVNKADKTVQYSESLNTEGKIYDQGGYLSRLDYFQMAAYSFGRSPGKHLDPDIKKQYTFKIIGQEDERRCLIYKMLNEEAKDCEIRAYVDTATQLAEKMVAISTDPNSPAYGEAITEISYDYSPIPDSVFEYAPASGEAVLPYKQKPCFRGQVVDLAGEPVSGADVFIHYFPLYSKKYLTGKSDAEGHFEIKVPLNPGGGSVHLPVHYWATMPNDPNNTAWTIMADDHFYFFTSDIRDCILGYGGDIVQTDSQPSIRSKLENGVETKEETINTIQRNPVIDNIRLVMEPAGAIGGYVRDQEGNPIENAKLTANFQAVDAKGGQSRFRSESINWKFSAVSDPNGFYRINTLPSLWKGCQYSIDVSAEGFVSETKRFTIDESLAYKAFDIALESQQVTITGVLKDNYGVPLDGRWVRISAPGMSIRDCDAKTDPNGLFVLEGCPDVPGMKLRASLHFSAPDGYPSITREEKDAYLFYPDVSKDIPYSAGQRAYVVELTAIRPETTLEVRVTDSADHPLPEFTLAVGGILYSEDAWDIQPISGMWKSLKLEGRTDENGRVVFDNIPDAKELTIRVAPGMIIDWEFHTQNGADEEKRKEKQRLDAIDRAYENTYQPMEVPVELVEGQTDYSVHVIVLTKDEFEALPDAAQ